MRGALAFGVLGGAVVLSAWKGGGEAIGVGVQTRSTAGSPAQAMTPASGDGAGSSIALVRQGSRRLALLADADGRSVRAVDVDRGEELAETPLEGTPSQIVVAADGRVYVSVRDRAEVAVLESSGDDGALRVKARASTAEEPTGLALTPDGRTLLVTCGWGHALDAFTTTTLERRFEVPVAREPRAVVASEDGARAYVSHAAASQVSVVDLVGEEHSVDPVRLDEPVTADSLQKQWRHGYALARTEMGVFAPGVSVDTGPQSERTTTYGGSDEVAERFEVKVVHPHAAGGRREADVEQDPLTSSFASSECMLPRAAAYDPAGQWLFVACIGGQDEVIRMDARRDTNNMSRRAVWSVGSEPTGIALDVDGRTLFVWSQRARTVMSTNVDEHHPASGMPDPAARTVVLGPLPDDPVARGREIFHRTGDGRISQDGRACESCHPDGRDDGLVWSTPDGPRQTPTLAGRLAGTAPYGWGGARATVKEHVTNTLTRLGGMGLPDDDMDALVAYCMQMTPPPRAAAPKAVAQDEALVAEGRDLFQSSKTDCGSCHMSDGTYTDGDVHDVNSKVLGDLRGRFDTPSLRFVGGTPPYFHDGRYPTLRALLAGADGTEAHDVAMGHTQELSSRELDALEAYLRTL